MGKNHCSEPGRNNVPACALSLELGQNVTGDSAGGWVAYHCSRGIGAISRTGREIAVGIQFEIRLQNAQRVRIGGGFIVFQGPGLGCAIDLAEIVNAGVYLRSLTGFYEIGNRDRSQKADDGHDDHNFHQCEPPLIRCSDFHTLSLFCCGGVNTAKGGLNINAIVHELPFATASPIFKHSKCQSLSDYALKEKPEAKASGFSQT